MGWARGKGGDASLAGGTGGCLGDGFAPTAEFAETSSGEHPEILRASEASRMDEEWGRHFGGANRPPVGVGRVLRAGRTPSAGLDALDDCNSGAGRGGAEDSCCLSQSKK